MDESYVIITSSHLTHLLVWKGFRANFSWQVEQMGGCHVCRRATPFVCFFAGSPSMLPFLLSINPPYFSCLLQVWKKNRHNICSFEVIITLLRSAFLNINYFELRWNLGLKRGWRISCRSLWSFQCDSAVLGPQSWSKTPLFMTVVLRILDRVNFLTLFRLRFYFWFCSELQSTQKLWDH